ncbi:MAG: M48 family metallopeptidase [Candidatus Edwardsbacteria bacterium]|jgi:STE24 endopeptidase|nr:M48 family metallopeptidase [Candidatus Edwardsbacteria bacterium]
MALLAAILVIGYLVPAALTAANVRHLRTAAAGPLPPALAGRLDPGQLRRTVEYTASHARLGYWGRLAGTVAAGAVLFSGLLPWLTARASVLPLPGPLQGLAVLYLPLLLLAVAGLPASLAEDFGIERRYGFSTITARTWALDQAKGLLIGAVLLGLLFCGFSLFVSWFGPRWWLPAWGLVTAVSLLLTFVAPVWLAPLFNKFVPLKDEALRDRILALAKQADFPLAGVFQMDASRRSTHDNAYFTGLGRTRRIVFYDTMVASYTHDEILAVMGHEIGHWKLRHVAVSLALSTAVSGAGLWLASQVINGEWVYATLGLLDQFRRSGLQGPLLGAALFAASVLFAPAGLLLSPLTMWLSRRHEYQADAFSLRLLPDRAALRGALLKLGAKNLANPFPHPLYVAFHYSHPPLLERLAAIDTLKTQTEP